ncbi:hypothetical protein J7L49_03060 [Candidatus Bathyarchaeota archaeon]|nr:hypothetical protein [Candidatus Bathyarchaeota archaeon]
MNSKIKVYPYIIFLPSKQKTVVLQSIFGSKAVIDILKFAISQGFSRKIYQKNIVEKLPYSNKTLIEHLKSLTNFGIFEEHMEKVKVENRTVWKKSYTLSDFGRWIALLLIEEEKLSNEEKCEILKEAFRSYLKWVRLLAEKLDVDIKVFKRIFEEEITGGMF